ncbi:polyprenyl synthetase family protein [Amycolatopsis echigonensis]|uniref:Geranylgeranyl diphosphate synthase type I n=1 Tax=Amycolatopsis echigonensis TaxID=2576905 RepID=A0A2N3WQ49_9PSEU|nr:MULTISPECIES: polyprenyl synthetase family protein [Amycolatopsis]MBB2505360.1 polyprenyl synthetase family protein [Amycolatopsis echigonensis]PKV95994.1 geranylgeranyl diphosphate synthase type I [Amycolatopsis niigatensis]
MTADVFSAAKTTTVRSAVPPVLGSARDVVQPALRAAVDRLDDTSRAISAYHLGWTDPNGVPVQGNGGKAVRSALAVVSAQAAGAPVEVGVPGAVAVELVHNFSLVHDDLMDGDTERRHRPTVWALYGSASAILTGDAMLALAQEVVLDSGSPHAVSAGRLLTETTRRLIHGQFLDVAFEQRDDVRLTECVTMAAGKTGALLSASAAIGAVLAGAPAEVVDALAVFGEEIGLAFQLVDDVLGIWGDPAVTGKSVYSDLRARKKSLPITYATTHGGAAGRRLAEWLAGDDDTDLARIAALVDDAGGREWATAEAARHVATAEQALAVIPPGPRADLVSIARFIAGREA